MSNSTNSGAVEQRRPLSVWSQEFAVFCQTRGIELRSATAAEAEISEQFAAQFILGILRESRWLRWRFPAALSGDEKSEFARWLVARGPRKFGLRPEALRKIQGVFRKPPSRQVFDFYLNIPELQQRFPFALLPMGQDAFLADLATERGVSHPFTDEQILWFVYQVRRDIAESVALTYLLHPRWQERFPRALTHIGWAEFTRWLQREYPGAFPQNSLGRPPRRHTFAGPPIPSDRAPFPEHGVTILSHFCYASGIQQAALFTRAALQKVGVTTSCRDVPAGVGTTLVDRRPWLGLEQFPVTIITIPPLPYLETCYARSGLHARDDVYRIGYWAWELERVPEEWARLAPMVDEIWAPTEFVASAMRASMARPVRTMLPGVELGQTERVARESVGVPTGHFVFLFMFDMASQMQRKNPLAVIRAFRRAFGRDERATLVIKVNRSELAPANFVQLESAARAEGVLLIDQMFSRSAAYGLMEMCDCFVSLHRSEGFGLALAEAMLSGKPTIATGYSGNADFMNPGNALLVDFEMTEITEDLPIYTRGNRWAEPSIEHAAALMRHLFEHREEAMALGVRAKTELSEKLSLRAAGARMAARLQAIQENSR